MKLTRLVNDEGDRFEARLLRTALAEEPPRGAIKRAEAALGLGVGAALSTTAAATAKAASAHAGAAHTVAQAGAVSIAKWVGIGMVSGLVVTGGARVASDPALRDRFLRSPSVSAGAPAHAPTMPAPRRALVAPATPTVVEAPHAEVAEATPAEMVARSPRRSVAETPAVITPSPLATPPPESPPTAAAPVASVTEELAILERARQALAAHAPDTALRELDVYAATPSARVLGAEAEILAVEALVQQRNIGEARVRAAQSLRRAPAGPHRERLRQVTALPDR